MASLHQFGLKNIFIMIISVPTKCKSASSKAFDDLQVRTLFDDTNLQCMKMQITFSTWSAKLIHD